MAFTIQHKRKAGTINDGDLTAAGEIGIDTSAKYLYFTTTGGDAIKVANFDDIAVGSIQDGDTLSTGLEFPAGGLTIQDAGSPAHTLALTYEGAADSTLTIDTSNASRLLTISADTTLGGGSHSGTNTGDQTITLQGDVTGSGTGTFTTDIAAGVVGTTELADDGVTYAKIQNVAANNVILGNNTAPDSVVDELTATEVKTILDLTTTSNVQFAALTVDSLTVSGTTTTVNSTTLDVTDKNITVAKGNTSDAFADGAGITVEGATAKTWNWVDATDAWTSSEHIDLVTGKEYKINNVTQVSSTALGSATTATINTTSTATLNGTLTTGAIDCGTL